MKLDNFEDFGGYWKSRRDEGYLDICWVQELFSPLFGLGKVYNHLTPILANSKDHSCKLHSYFIVIMTTALHLQAILRQIQDNLGQIKVNLRNMQADLGQIKVG